MAGCSEAGTKPHTSSSTTAIAQGKTGKVAQLALSDYTRCCCLLQVLRPTTRISAASTLQCCLVSMLGLTTPLLAQPKHQSALASCNTLHAISSRQQHGCHSHQTAASSDRQPSGLLPPLCLQGAQLRTLDAACCSLSDSHCTCSQVAALHLCTSPYCAKLDEALVALV